MFANYIPVKNQKKTVGHLHEHTGIAATLSGSCQQHTKHRSKCVTHM